MDDRALSPFDHIRRDHTDQPVVRNDVIVENLSELLVADASHRSIIGIGRRIADQEIYWAKAFSGFAYQPLKAGLVRNAGSDRNCAILTMTNVNRVGNFFTRGLLTAGDHDPRPRLHKSFSDCAANAP